MPYCESVADVQEFFRCQSMDDLVDACNDLYYYHYIVGRLPDNSIIFRWHKETDIAIAEICEQLEEYMSEKLSKTIRLMMIEHPKKFIDTCW